MADGKTDTRAHNAGLNINTGISAFLIYETGMPVLIPVSQKQTVRCSSGKGSRLAVASYLGDKS
jgi:hypothetical protein